MDGGPAEQTGSGSALQRRLSRIAGSWNLELTCENLTWLAVALGVILRVWEYLEFRPLYMDESTLLANVADRAIFDFRHVLEGDQMAPPGFLAVERLPYVWGGRDLRAVAPRSDSANFPGFFSILCSVFRDSVVTIFRVIS